MNVVAWISRHRGDGPLITPHLHGGDNLDKVRYEFDAADEFWSTLQGTVKPEVMTGQDVLDIGCGWGGKLIRYAEELAPRSITGFDLPDAFDPGAPSAFAAARGIATCRFEGGHAENMPFGAESFDVAIMDDVLEHVEDPKRVLDESWRVLRPGGLLIAKFPSIRMIRAHHLDRALTFPALHYLRPLGTWAAGLNHLLLRSPGQVAYEPFDKVIDGRFGRAVTRNLNGLDFASFQRIADDSDFTVRELKMVGTQRGPATLKTLPKWIARRIILSSARLFEAFSSSVVFLGEKSAHSTPQSGGETL